MPTSPTQALRVTQFISLCNTLLRDVQVRVEGEISSFAVNKGIYVFFDLKDEEEEAKVNCFMMANRLTVPIEDGMRVVVSGRPGIHQKSGKFSLTAEAIEPVGEGSLKRAFELLKQKLAAEGLFDSARKRPLPRYPTRVGIISSLEAAGFGDFRRIAWQRLPGVEFILANVSVQGESAVAEICTAFDELNSRFELDAIVLIRGGGSIEDLQAFNSEPVARAVTRSKAPVIVGVGHERDVTIADFCADVRAATPSNAAQLLIPTREEIEEYVRRLSQSGSQTVATRIAQIRESIYQRCLRFDQRLRTQLQEQRTHTAHLMRTIEALAPQATLARGYTLTRDVQGKVARSPQAVLPGSAFSVQFAEGTISATRDLNSESDK